MTRFPGTTLLAGCLLAAPIASGLRAQQPAGPGKTYAQQLVDRLVSQNRDVTGVELAVISDSKCATLAGTDPNDIGAKCGEDEQEPMRTGEPFVEEPAKDDRIYDITQALHDTAGRLIGAVGIDITPDLGQDRAAVLARARVLLLELEAAIPSKEKLFERSASR